MRNENPRMLRRLAVGMLALAVIVGNVALNIALPLRVQVPAEVITPIDKAQLWVKNFKSLKIVVEDVPTNSIGLATDDVQTKTELRLRSVGIQPLKAGTLTPPDYAHLSVAITVVGAAFSVELEFQRMTSWTLPNGENSSFITTTWHAGSTGTHGSQSGYVLGALDRILDKFLNAYLKANQ